MKSYHIKSFATPLLAFFILHSSFFVFSSCTEQESSMVEFEEDNNLDTPNDTVYSLLGIIQKLQQVADRTQLFGELRGDLVTLTDHASLELQALANFTAGTSSPYNKIADYYAVIQNCNYFLSHADMQLMKRGVKVFEKEYAVIKAYRAWTYMQLALNYGNVPFFTEPLLTENDANPAAFPKYDIRQMADFFIQDLAPLVDSEFPSYGNMSGYPSRRFYIPVRVLLGDFCLWSGRYREAAQYYHDYFTKTGNIHPTTTRSIGWEDQKFERVLDAYRNSFTTPSDDEILTIIPLEEEEFNGTVTHLDDVFDSTDDNKYYFQATPSPAYKELSRSQRFVVVYADLVTLKADTVSPPEDMVYSSEDFRGDLRLFSCWKTASLISNSSNISSVYQQFDKLGFDYVILYRLSHVYLRYAEALNRAGFPEAAFFVLKYGLCNDHMDKYMSPAERSAAGDLITFSGYTFTTSNTQGIHSRGSGKANADKSYVIPELASKNDSILWVEDKLVEEMALETAGEGLRFYDLMRIALRRGDPSFLAKKVASRGGTANFDSDLYQTLCNPQKWYLPY